MEQKNNDRLKRLTKAETNEQFTEILLSEWSVLTNDKLKNLFPQHRAEIMDLSKHMACGCSCCVLGILRAKYGVELPKEYEDSLGV